MAAKSMDVSFDITTVEANNNNNNSNQQTGKQMLTAKSGHKQQQTSQLAEKKKKEQDESVQQQQKSSQQSKLSKSPTASAYSFHLQSKTRFFQVNANKNKLIIDNILAAISSFSSSSLEHLTTCVEKSNQSFSAFWSFY